MPSWPATLPQYVNVSGYQESLPDQTIESAVDAGPPKVRRRFTANYRAITATIWVDGTQRAAFETFFETTLAGGSLAFDWVNPLTQAAASFRFRRPPPAYEALGGDTFAIRMNLWQLP